MLGYKLEDKDGSLVVVDRFFPSSQLCSVCGCKNSAVKDLSVRKWTCTEYEAHHDRNRNACANLLAEGLRIQQAAASA